MLRKVKAIYSSLIGLSVLGVWIMMILADEITEGSIEISFHILEFKKVSCRIEK